MVVIEEIIPTMSNRFNSYTLFSEKHKFKTGGTFLDVRKFLLLKFSYETHKKLCIPKNFIISTALNVQQSCLLYFLKGSQIEPFLLIILPGAKVDFLIIKKVVFGLNYLFLYFYLAHKGSWLAMGL